MTYSKKTKILKYSDRELNKVVQKYVELEQRHESVYTYVIEKHPSDPEYDMLMLVLKIKDVYVAEGSYRRYLFAKPKLLPSAVSFAENYIEKIYKKIQEEKFITTMHVRVFEALGLDTSPLIEARKKRVLKKLQQQQEEQKKKQDEALQKAKEEGKRLKEVLQAFIKGENISTKDFLQLCKMNNVSIHIWTIGTFNKSTTEVNIDGTIWYIKKKGLPRPHLNGCFDAVKQLRGIIK